MAVAHPGAVIGGYAFTAPSYQACRAGNTRIVGGILATPGATFCLIRPGRIAGVAVYAGSARQASLAVVVWRS